MCKVARRTTTMCCKFITAIHPYQVHNTKLILRYVTKYCMEAISPVLHDVTLEKRTTVHKAQLFISGLGLPPSFSFSHFQSQIQPKTETERTVKVDVQIDVLVYVRSVVGNFLLSRSLQLLSSPTCQIPTPSPRRGRIWRQRRNPRWATTS